MSGSQLAQAPMDARPFLNWPLGTHPVEQAHLYTPVALYDWQEDILCAAAKPHSRVIASTNNESGKSSVLIPVFILSCMTRFRECSCFVTSASDRQVSEQVFFKYLVPAAVRFRWKFTKDPMKITASNGSTCLCYVCRDAGNVEGFHGDWAKDRHGLYYRPCVYALDECKTIKDDVHEAVRRIDPDFMLALSTPGESSGFFWQGVENVRVFS